MINPKILLFVIAFCATSFLEAQQNGDKNFFYHSIKGSTTIASQKVVTYTAPSIGAAIDDTLFFGTSMQVLMLVPYSESVNGIEVPWVKCIYKKGAFNKVTFVLASNLALSSAINNNTLATINFISANTDSLFFEVKLINNLKTISHQQSIGFLKSNSLDSFRIELINSNGLQKVASVFGVHIYSNKVKNSYHFIECLNGNSLIALEKVELDYSTTLAKGKVWNFPSMPKGKKNYLSLINVPVSSKKSSDIKVYKVKNCSIL